MSPSHKYGSLVKASITKPAFLKTSGRLFTCSSQFCPLISKISDGFSHLPPTKTNKNIKLNSWSYKVFKEGRREDSVPSTGCFDDSPARYPWGRWTETRYRLWRAKEGAQVYKANECQSRKVVSGLPEPKACTITFSARFQISPSLWLIHQGIMVNGLENCSLNTGILKQGVTHDIWKRVLGKC